LMMHPEVGIVGKSITPRKVGRAKTRMSDKMCEVWHAGSQGLQDNLDYIKRNLQGMESQKGLPDHCRAVRQVGGQWQVIRPEHEDAQPTMEQKTAVRIKDIPCGFCTTSIKQKIDDTGYPGKYSGKYNFVHLPKNVDEKRTGRSMGYGFVNFIDASVASEFLKEWPEYYKATKISENSRKQPGADWATRRHGFDANLRHHQHQDLSVQARNPDDKPQFLYIDSWCVLVDKALVPIS